MDIQEKHKIIAAAMNGKPEALIEAFEKMENELQQYKLAIRTLHNCLNLIPEPKTKES